METPTMWIDLMGAEVRYHDAGGIRTRAIEAGEGTPLILLHGIGGHAEAYSRNVVELARAGFHVYAIDMVGHGLTAKPDQPYGTGPFARHLLSFIDAIGAERVCLSGESIGGWTAAWLAVSHPDRLQSLVLNTPSGIAIDEHGDDVTPAQYQERRVELRKRTLAALDDPTRETVRSRMEWLVLDPETLTEELVESRYRIYCDPEFIVAQRRYWTEDTSLQGDTELLTRERLASIEVPTLVLWTSHDPFLPWEVGEQMHGVIPGSEFVVMQGCGHWPQFEKPEEFNAVVVDFLRR
jgi:2-hydroxy-6-oxo-6-(2'-carboxyphenyl)-hexa-2,4-dienoate hydrolase